MALYLGNTRYDDVIIGVASTDISTVTLTVTANGSYSPQAGTYYSGVTVNVPAGSAINNQNKTVTPTTASQQVRPDTGYTGLAQVTVNAIPSNFIVPSGNLAITANAENIDVSQYATASINVPTGGTINNQNKTVTPTSTTQSVSADSGYTGLGLVTVNPIPSEYVIPTGTKTITENGTGIDVGAFATVDVDIDSVNNQAKTATPTKSSQVITPDSTYTGLSSVTINPIPNEYIIPAGDYRITSNGKEIDIAQYSTVTVDIPVGSTINNQNKTVTPTKASQSVTADSGYTGLGTVTVNAIPANFIEPSGTKTITENGTGIDVTEFASVDINIDTVNNQTKSVTPTESAQTVTPDSGYTGLSSVSVGAISDTYVGSAIDQRSNSDLTVSGPTVTAPAGYYATAASKSVATATHANPTITFTTATGAIKASHAATTGYVTAGTTSATMSLSTQAAATITPSESTQTAVAAYKYTTGAVTVAAITATYVGSGVTKRSSITAFGATVYAYPGYYAATASRAVVSGSAATPATSITATLSISISSTGLITASTSASRSITPTVSTGWVSSGIAGIVGVHGSDTLQLITNAGSTVTPSPTTQTLSISGAYMTGNVIVEPIPSNYKTTNDATALVTDIISGKTAYVDNEKITGTLVVNRYFVGSSAPTSSLGNNGDIYLQM